MGDVAPLDRAAVTRVLRRATELSDAGAHLDVDAIDERALVAAATEVGITADAVRRAIAVERLGTAPSPHLGDRLVGPGTVVVDDQISGRVDEVLARLDDWFVSGHHLRRDRLRDGQGEWTKRSGLAGATARTIRGVTGEGRLGETRRLAATVRDTGAGTCVVRVEADRRTDRIAYVATGAVVGAAGTVGVVAAALLAGPLLLLAAPATLAAGVGVAAAGRGRAARVGREVSRVLDAVDRRSPPARLSVDVVRRVAGRPRRP